MQRIDRFFFCADYGNGEYLCAGLPEEGVLFSVHPGLQLQCGVLSKRRHNEAEEQSDQHEHSRQDNLKHRDNDKFTIERP